MQKTALITGVTGQDGAYLAQLLLDKGYTVYGAYRRTSAENFWRIDELGIQQHPQLHLVEYDLTDLGASIALVQKVQPTEIYNLAAQSFVGVSFEQPSTTAQITGLGALNLLEAIRLVNPKIRFYQASTSEMFGKVQANVGTRQYCEGAWNVGADKMHSARIKCEKAQFVSSSISELELNGWESKSHTLAPHITDYAPNGVPGFKRLTVVMQKVRVVPYFSDSYNNRYALPGEARPDKD